MTTLPTAIDNEIVPRPWTKGIDQNGHAYYVNTESGQIRRQPPVNLTDIIYGNPNEYSTFIDPEQWDLVIETMAVSIHPDAQLRVFQKLKKIAEKMITKDDPKFRQLYLNNPKLQKYVLQYDGGIEFLYHLGFQPDPNHPSGKLICSTVNSRVVQAALICLLDKIEVLSYDIQDSFKPRLDGDLFNIVTKCKGDCSCTKMVKTFVFICDGEKSTPWNSKQDKCLSAIGIDEANKLAQFLKGYSDFNHAKKTIFDASDMMTTNVLCEYSDLLKNMSPDLLSQLMQINDMLSDANVQLQNTMFTDCISTEQESETGTNETDQPLSAEFVLRKIVNSSNKSIIVTSNLQTAISTTIFALEQRLNADKNECIHILPSLRKLKVMTKVMVDLCTTSDNDSNAAKLKQMYDERLSIVNEETWRDLRSRLLIEGFIRTFVDERLIIPEIINCIVPFYHEYLTGGMSDTMVRFKFFCDWAFGENEDIFDTVIVCGHTNWFKQFFGKFMPTNCSWRSVVENQSLQNGSVVGFKMCSHISSPHHLKRYNVVADSMIKVYKGFEEKNDVIQNLTQLGF